jgi:hypothetical protein
LALFGNSFTSAGSYSDCYTFSLSGQANSFGGTITLDPWLNKLNIAVTSVSLFRAGALLGTDTSPFGFSFGSLVGGNSEAYTLQVQSKVTGDFGLYRSAVGYAGVITTLAAPVPEPTAYAQAVAGFAVVGVVAWRRRRASRRPIA